MFSNFMYVSCAFDELYAGGAAFPEQVLLRDGGISADARSHGIIVVEQVYEAASYGTPFSPIIFTQDNASTRALWGMYDSLARKVAAPSVLTTIEDALSFGSVIYCGRRADRRIVYETHRLNDRPAVSLASAELLGAEERAEKLSGRTFLFLGSAGSFNYGHFLVDDLPRLKAAEALANSPSLTVVMPKYGEAIDSMRRQAVQAFLGSGIDMLFLSPDKLYRFDQLHYVSPVSLHPVQKNPRAVAWTVERALALADAAPPQVEERILVARHAAAGRVLVNQAAVAEALARLGYTLIYPEKLSFLDQVRRFAGAGQVIGLMGAAMTNTMFSPERTSLLYLAPDGWSEPFYWDLAMTRQQSYRIAFGDALMPGVPPHRSDFAMDVEALLALM